MAVQPIEWGGGPSLQELVYADQVRGQRQARNRMAPLIEPALSGDRTALAGVFQQDSAVGARLAQAVAQMDVAKQRDLKMGTDFILRDGMAILQAPAAQRPDLYRQSLATAGQYGIDVSTMPTEYGPDAEAKLKFIINRYVPISKALKNIGGGAGGGAPAGDIWSPVGPRVSSAPQPAGPTVANAPQAAPVTGAPTVPVQPQLAAAAPTPMPAPSLAPAVPAVSPAAAPTAPVQMADSGQPPLSPDMTYTDKGDGGQLTITEGGQQRLIALPPGHRPAFFDRKTGKPERDGDDMYVIPVDAKGQRTGPAVIWRIPPKRDPQQPAPVSPGWETDPDNPNRWRPKPGGPHDPVVIASQPKPPSAGYEPNPNGLTPTAQRPIEGGSATEKLRTFDQGARDVFRSADRFLDLFKATDSQIALDAASNNPRSPEAQRLLSAYTAMITSLRGDAFINTGVLQPAEMEMLRNDFLSPQTLRGAFATPQAMQAKLTELKDYIQTRRENAFAANGLPVPPFDTNQPSAADVRETRSTQQTQPASAAPSEGTAPNGSSVSLRMPGMPAVDMLREARDAIARGADRAKVIERLRSMGVSTGSF